MLLLMSIMALSASASLGFFFCAFTVIPSSAAPQGSFTITPSTTEIPGGTFDCNFDQSFCAWRQDGSDDLNWSMSTTGQKTGGTGVIGDHTGGKLCLLFLFPLPNTVMKYLSLKAHFKSAISWETKKQADFNCERHC